MKKYKIREKSFLWYSKYVCCFVGISGSLFAWMLLLNLMGGRI